MDFLAYLYPFPYAVKASPATRLLSADPIPSARSAVDPPSLTSDSSPGREGGSEEGTSTSELLFLQGQKAPDPAVASHSSHPQRTPTYPRKHDTRPGCHQEECCGFCTLYLVQLNVAPGLGATWSWEEECRGHQAPPVTWVDWAFMVGNTAFQVLFSFSWAPPAVSSLPSCFPLELVPKLQVVPAGP